MIVIYGTKHSDINLIEPPNKNLDRRGHILSDSETRLSKIKREKCSLKGVDVGLPLLDLLETNEV